MSAPATAIIAVNPAIVILAAAGYIAAEAISGYRQAADLREQNQAQREQNLAAQKQAGAEGQKALLERVQQTDERYNRLTLLAMPLGVSQALHATRPQRPAEQNPSALAAYVEQMRQLCNKLEEALRETLGEDAVTKGQGLSLEALEESLREPRETGSPLPPPPPDASIRLLARLASLGPLPEEIDKLARELKNTTHTERARLLELELRQAIQQFEERAVQKASALVLEQTLKDLGYQVEPVSDTLFVEGGITHFRRQGWNDHLVRMRIDAKKMTANFNVIRAVKAGDDEHGVMDHLAEDRWCTEFPAFLQALAARGLELEVTRQLPAGELPVQLVDRELLPRFSEEENQQRMAAPKQKQLR
ncbi:MAG: hypothetical protein LBU43_02655 [Candidatus Accumulibacter sp.]|jgi:hypothetical protein|nr:hypothetical protein [Accumulibacter sp.]